MTAADLLAALRRLGITVRSDGQRIGCKPTSAMSSELQSQVAQHRAGLLELLREEHASGVVQDPFFGPLVSLTGHDATTGPGTRCYSCRGARWWRLKGRAHWVCHACHPPIPTPSLIEVMGGSDSECDRSSPAGGPGA